MSGAKECLRKMKGYENQIKKVQESIITIEAQIMEVENASLARDVMKSMQVASHMTPINT